MRANFEIGCKDTTNPQGCCGLTLVIVGQSPTKSEKVGRGGEGIMNYELRIMSGELEYDFVGLVSIAQ